jgi:hypothetical protein
MRLKVEWDDSKAEKRGTPEIMAEYKKARGRQRGGRGAP